MLTAIFPVFLLSVALSGPSSDPLVAGLADAIVDGSYGVSVRPPKDWRIIRRRVPERRGVTLVQMVHPLGAGQMEEIVLKYTSTTQPVPMDEMLKRISETIELEHSGVEIHSQQQQELAGRRGGVLAASFLHEGRRKFRMQAIIEARPQVYFVLLYDGPAELRAESEPLFNLVLGSLELLIDQIKEEDLAVAMQSGRRFLGGLRPEDLTRVLVPEQFLRFELEGKTVGFVVIWQREQNRDGRPGVLVKERAWMFEPDGRARRLQSNMWVSTNLKHERWETSITSLVPATAERPASLEVTLEDGLRAEKVLLTSQQFGLDQPMTENPPIQLSESYVPRAVLRMLPQLLGDLDRPRMLAFVTFDHSRVGMIARVVEVKGAVELPEGASTGKVFLVEDREGLASLPSEMYVDETGRSIRVESGEMCILPTTAKEMEREFEAKINEAERQMETLEAAHQATQRRFRPRPGR